jgi:hypothetical protein
MPFTFSSYSLPRIIPSIQINDDNPTARTERQKLDDKKTLEDGTTALMDCVFCGAPGSEYRMQDAANPHPPID